MLLAEGDYGRHAIGSTNAAGPRGHPRAQRREQERAARRQERRIRRQERWEQESEEYRLRE
jgi:hypothetical protein